ncbi:hypothetical protein [Myroides odoratus]|uniref:hypothetical protein n=1 Tax=Myroides odoratus TaxID=256 RepID=UPI0039B0480F
MKRKTIVRVHIGATIVAMLTILTFFGLSLFAEIKGKIQFIMQVKTFILYALPVMIITMPVLKITGDKLAGKAKNPILLAKQKRMKWMLINGMGLLVLAIFLYCRSHLYTMDYVFFLAQMVEFMLGLANLTLLIINAKQGMQLSKK